MLIRSQFLLLTLFVASFCLVNASNAQQSKRDEGLSWGILSWHSRPLTEPAADLDGDGYLTMSDVGLLLALFRSSPDPEFLEQYKYWVRGDINFDKAVDEQDLHLLLHLITEDLRPKGCARGKNCCALPVEYGGCCGEEGMCPPVDMKSYRPPYRQPVWQPIPDPIDLTTIPIVGAGLIPSRTPTAPDEDTVAALRSLLGLPHPFAFEGCYPATVENAMARLRTLDDAHARWLLGSAEPALIVAGLFLVDHLHRPNILADFPHHLDDNRDGPPDLICDMRANVIIGGHRYSTTPRTLAERARVSVKRWFGIDPVSSEEFRAFLPESELALDRLQTWTSLMTAARRSYDAPRRDSLRDNILALPEHFRWAIIASEQKERDRSARADNLVFDRERAAEAMARISDDLRSAILEHRAPVPADVMRRARFTTDPSAELRTLYDMARRAMGDPGE